MEQEQTEGLRQQIRLFVSSTFCDLQEERNTLARRCFPAARRAFARAGHGFAEIDLRWGLPVGVSEEVIVDLCLIEVERCRGYFVCVLGERYGYVPADVQRVSNKLGLPVADGISITEVEVRHGVLDVDHAHYPFVRFFFKEDARADNARLDRLKAEIVARGLPVRSYCNPDQLADQLRAELEQLAAALPSVSVPAAERLVGHLTRGVVPRVSVLNRLDVFLASRRSQLCVTGSSGCGKTTVLAQWIDAHRRSAPATAGAGWRATVKQWLFGGGTPRTTDLWLFHSAGATSTGGLDEALTHLIDQLEPGDAAALALSAPLRQRLQTLRSLVERALKSHRRVILVIDGIDDLQLDPVLPFHWLPEAADGLRIVLAGRSGGVEATLPPDRWERVAIGPLAASECQDALAGYLQTFGKRLPVALLNRAVHSDATSRPLFLRLLADELRLAETPEHLEALAPRLLAARGPEQLFDGVLDRLETEVSEAAVAAVCRLLVCCRGGLEEAELRAMTRQTVGLSERDWLLMAHHFFRSVVEADGRFGIYNDELRACVWQRYLSDAGEENAWRRRIADWCAAECRLAGGITPGVVAELPWQLERMEAWAELAEWLSLPDFFSAAWRLDPLQVIGYWRTIEEASSIDPGVLYSGWLASGPDCAELLVDAGLMLAQLGHAEVAVAIAQEVDRRATVPRADVASAANRLNLAGFLLETGRLPEAGRVLEQATGWLRTIDPASPLQRAVLTLRGNWQRESGDLTAALASHAAARVACEEAGDDHMVQVCCYNQGLVLIAQGNYGAARKILSDSVRHFERVHDIDALCSALQALASACEQAGLFKPALEALAKLDALTRQSRDHIRLVHALQARARLIELTGDRDAAEAMLLECAHICRASENVEGLVDTLIARAAVRKNLGPIAYPSARRLLAEAAELAHGSNLSAQVHRIDELLERINAGKLI